MASKQNKTKTLQKRKSKTLIDTSIGSVANIAKNKVTKSANDAVDANSAQNIDQNVGQSAATDINQSSSVAKKVDNNDANASNQKLKKVDVGANSAQQQSQIDASNANVVDNSSNTNNANKVNAVEPIAAQSKIKWVTDKKGNRVKEKELKVLQQQWDDYAKQIADNVPKGLDGISLNDKTYFPDIKWNDLAPIANKEYKKMDVNALAQTWGKVVKDENLVLLSEPHNKKKSGFAIARKIIEDTKPAGVIMMEIPASLNQSPDLVKAVGYWAKTNAQDPTFATFVKEAVEKGWKVVPIDAVNPNNDLVDSEHMTDAEMPAKWIRSNGIENPVGSKARQAYLARNLLHTVQDNPNKGSVFLVGNAHIRSRRIPHLSPMISKTATIDAPSQTNMSALADDGSVSTKGMKFRIVEVDTDASNLNENVVFEPK